MTAEESRLDTERERIWPRELLRSLGAPESAPTLLLLAGSAGTGKTWTLRRLLALPEARAVPRLLLRCTAGGLVPAGDLARAAEVGRCGPTSEALAGRAPGSGVAERAPTQGRAERAPDPIRQLAALRAVDSPRLLAVEDLQRATPPVRAALRGLLEQPPGGLATVLTYRPEELPEPGLALGGEVSYPSSLTVVRKQVGTLSPAQVRAIATELLGPEHCTAEFVRRLHQRTGGVAQVVVDLLRAAAEYADERQQRPAPRDLDRVEVPVRLSELVLARVATLEEPARRVVWAAAVLGEPSSTRDLAAVAGVPRRESTQAVSTALHSAALCWHGTDRYGFAVPLEGRAVYEQLAGPLRQELHGRAADLLARRQPVPWGNLARHRRDSGQLAGWAKAVERAAQDCVRSGEHQLAVRLLEEALGHPGMPSATRVRLAPLLAKSAVVGLRSDQTVRVLRHIADDRTLPTAVRGKVRLDLGLLFSNQLGQGVQGRIEMERAVEELGDQPALTARVMSALAIPYWPTASLSECLVWLDRARQAAADSGDATVRVAVAANHVSVLLGTGDPAGWQLLDALPRDDNDPAHAQHVARGLCNCADASVLLGYYERAAELLTEGIERSVSSGASYQEQTGRGAALLLDWCTGNWKGLAGRCEAFVAEAGEMPVIVEDARVVLGLLALSRGEWAQSARWLSGEGFPAPEDGSVPLVAVASGAHIRLALAREDLAAARTEADAAWARVRKSEVWVWAAELAPWVVEANARARGPQAVRELVSEFAEGLEGRDSPAAEAALLWCRALLAETEGEARSAVALFREASERYARMPRPYQQALTAEAAFRCATAAGEEPDTTDLVNAVEQFSTLGASWDTSRARAMLRARQPVDERRSPGRPGYGDQLSPRETEVADLAAAGLTNREIAGTLHLSPRTVEQHVARAMRKLGTQSRQALASERSAASPDGAHGPDHVGARDASGTRSGSGASRTDRGDADGPRPRIV